MAVSIRKDGNVISRQRIVFCYFSPKEIDYTPVDIGCIVALLEQKFPGKYACEILQLDYRLDTYARMEALREHDVNRSVDLIGYHRPTAVFIFCESILWSKVNAFWRASSIAEELKRRQPDLFVGLQSYRAQKPQIDEVFAKGSVDCVVMGDAERSFLRIADLLASRSVLGTIYRNPDKIAAPDQGDAACSPSGSLDGVPSPYLHHIFDNYLQANQARKGGMFRAFLASSRGCGFKCEYCFRSIKFEKVRYFKAQRFYDEMEYLFVNFGIRRFFVLDDAFLCSRQRLQEFRDEFHARIARHPGMSEIRMFIMTRPEMIADEETIRLLADIGVDTIQIGLQTIHPDLQSYMNRSIELLRFKRISDWMQKHRVRLHLDLIVGLPGDSIEWMKETLRFALLLDPYSLQIKQFYLNTDTLLFRKKDLLDIRIEGGKPDFETPFVTGAKGIDAEYLDEADRFIMRQAAEFPDIKWKYVAARRVFVSEGIYWKETSKQERKSSEPVNHGRVGYYDLLWRIPSAIMPDRTMKTLVCSGGAHVGFSTDSKSLAMIDQVSGAVRWIFRTNPFDRKESFSSPIMMEQHVYVGTPDGNICGLDASDGRHLWAFFGLSRTSPDFAYSQDMDTIFSGGTEGMLRKRSLMVALDGASGALRWRAPLDQVSHTSPLYSDHDGGLLVVIGDQGGVYGLDARSGEERFRFAIRGWVPGNPVMLDMVRQRIIFGVRDGSLRTLHLGTGKTSVFFGRPGIPMCDALIACGEERLIACSGNRIRNIDLGTGELLWEYVASEERACPPAVAERSVWILSAGGRLEEIDLAKGNRLAYFQSDLLRGGSAMEYDRTSRRLLVAGEAGLLCLSRRLESRLFGDRGEK